MSIKLDVEVALKTFVERYIRASKTEPINNGNLPAGSPMYYYCKHCGTHTETLSEGHWSRPTTICDPCKVLDDHGLIPEGVKRAKAQMKAEAAASPQAKTQ
jgi:hypothetical protein